MRPLNTAFLLALCAGLLAAPAHAEKADRDKPINLEADTVTLDDIRKISVYEGNVILSQGTLMLRAPGTVDIQDGVQTLRAGAMEYDAGQRVIKLSGRVQARYLPVKG